MNCSVWHEDATFALISIWGDSKIQDGFDGTRRNASTYATIQNRLKQLGYHFQVRQVINKCKSLRKQYHMIKEEHKKTGSGPMHWLYFNKMDAVFCKERERKKKVASPPAVATNSEVSSAVAGLGSSNFTETDAVSECSDVSFPELNFSLDDEPDHDDGAGSSKDVEIKEDVGQTEESEFSAQIMFSELATNQQPEETVDAAAQRSAKNNMKRKRYADSIGYSKKPKYNSLINSFANAMRQVNREFETRFFEHLREMERERMHWEELREEREEKRLQAQEERNHARQIQFLQAINNIFRPSAETKRSSQASTSKPQQTGLQTASMISTNYEHIRNFSYAPPSSIYDYQQPLSSMDTSKRNDNQPTRSDQPPRHHPPASSSASSSSSQHHVHRPQYQSTSQPNKTNQSKTPQPSTSIDQTVIKHEHLHVHHRTKSSCPNDLMNYLAPARF
ncbi:uncharacterized protein [Antedon mediterranea]|uniref:uncharacterized protein n=1 Tax=Antedon mediterranea TaxID=105859 RepID=UPI003AF928AC